MDLSLKKLIKLILEDKKLLILYLVVCLLFYPVYFSIFKLKTEKSYKVDLMLNYSIPNSISAMISESFVNLMFYKISENKFDKIGFKCAINVNEIYKSKTIECVDKNEKPNFENFKKIIYNFYEEHVNDFAKSIEQFPFVYSDRNEINNFDKEYLRSIIKEKENKFFLRVYETEKKDKFNFIHYITSFILIFFFNVFRILIKY